MFVYGGSGGAQYGREADRAPDYSSNVWEFKYATVQWVKHVVAVGSVSPLPAFGMAGEEPLEFGMIWTASFGRGTCLFSL